MFGAVRIMIGAGAKLDTAGAVVVDDPSLLQLPGAYDRPSDIRLSILGAVSIMAGRGALILGR